MKATQASTTRAEEERSKWQADVDQLRADLQKSKDSVKDEEEKRVKAISLLKTVRQKLVKAEKDRDDSVKELAAMKEKEKGEKDKERAEREKLQKELESVRDEKQKDIVGLKTHFDREVAGMKDKMEKEFAARKGQFELEAITTKVYIRLAHSYLPF